MDTPCWDMLRTVPEGVTASTSGRMDHFPTIHVTGVRSNEDQVLLAESKGYCCATCGHTVKSLAALRDHKLATAHETVVFVSAKSGPKQETVVSVCSKSGREEGSNLLVAATPAQSVELSLEGVADQATADIQSERVPSRWGGNTKTLAYARKAAGREDRKKKRKIFDSQGDVYKIFANVVQFPCNANCTLMN
jgi:hypothetical protein